MKTANNDIIKAIHSRSRHFDFYLEFENFNISNVENFTVTAMSCDTTGLTFGTVAIGNGSFAVKKNTQKIAVNDNFNAYAGIAVNNAMQWAKIGRYHITNITVTGITTTVTFEDDIALLDVPFKEELTYPIAAKTVVSKIATLCDVVIDLTDIPDDLMIANSVTNYSCRDILKFVAQLLGTFVAYDANVDKIAFRWYNDTGYAINADNHLYMIKEPTISDVFTLGTISNNNGADIVTASLDNADGVVSLSNPLIGQEEVNALLTLRGGFNYTTASVDFVLGNPLLDVWDIVKVTYKDNSAIIPCMQVQHTFDGGFTTSIQSFTRSADTEFEGQITKQFEDVKTQITAVDGKVSSKVSKGDIISEINQSAETIQIKAEKIELDGETIADKLTADEATIGGWTIADNKLKAGGKDGIKVAAVQAPKSSNMWVFAAGGDTHDTYNDCPFRVDRLGRMWATQANISGVVNAESGGIGRWTIVDGKMECKLSTFLEPVPDDSETVMKYLYGQITLTDTQLIAFDFNCDGTVDEDDATIMSNLIYNGFYGDRITVSEAIQQGIISSNYVMNNSLVTITIDPSDVVHAISLKGTTQWGGEVYKYFGIDSPFMGDDPYLQIEEYLKSGGWVYNTFQDYYDLISSKAPNTLVTQTEDGLMSAADKLKLDGISSQYALVNSLALRVNNDNVLWTFNGSKGESINLVAGNGIAFSPSSNGTIMISATGTGGTATGDVGYVLYEAPNDYGIYCDGNTTPNSTNSVILSDVSPNGSYKRFRIYVKTIYGLACADMPVDRTHSATATFNSVYSGGIIFPTGDNVSGASSNYLAKIQWAITHIPSTGWRIQVTDSGWINLGMGNVSADEYSQASAAKSGTSVTWNQRHNSGYSIYKVVGYIVD